MPESCVLLDNVPGQLTCIGLSPFVPHWSTLPPPSVSTVVPAQNLTLRGKNHWPPSVSFRRSRAEPLRAPTPRTKALGPPSVSPSLALRGKPWSYGMITPSTVE